MRRRSRWRHLLGGEQKANTPSSRHRGAGAGQEHGKGQQETAARSPARLLAVPPHGGKGLDVVGDGNTAGSFDLGGVALHLRIFRTSHHGWLLRNMLGVYQPREA